MNGYNWEAFFNYYLGKNYPEILEGIDFDPEAGMFTVYYDYTPENEIKAEKFKAIICLVCDSYFVSKHHC